MPQTFVVDPDPTYYLPHRHPFLFVSKVIEVTPGRYAIAEYQVPDDHYAFQGHFPGKPIFPGALLLEAMAQTGGIALNAVEKGRLMLLAGVDKARFKRPVVPGDLLVIRAKVVEVRGRFVMVTASASRAEDRVAAADLVYAV